jgi:hypothetical protein
MSLTISRGGEIKVASDTGKLPPSSASVGCSDVGCGLSMSPALT